MKENLMIDRAIKYAARPARDRMAARCRQLRREGFNSMARGDLRRLMLKELRPAKFFAELVPTLEITRILSEEL